MLSNQTMEKLQALRLTGMVQAWNEQMQLSEVSSLSFEERLGLMVDREMTLREDRRLQTRLKKARLRVPACMEDLDFSPGRGLNKSVVMALASCDWIKKRQNLIITGPTGGGKTYLACALVHKACLEGYNALYRRLPNLLQDVAMAKGDGSYHRLMNTYAKADLLTLDDWGLSRLTREQSLDLLELVEDRHGLKSTMLAAQVPVEKWHEVIGDPTLADAILDRLVHNAHTITLKGESMRKKYAALTKQAKID